MKSHSYFNYKKNFLPFTFRYSVKKGFTLVEVLIVITILATLAIAVFIALNPGKRLADSRDSRRLTDVESILNAIHAYIIDNKGILPPSMVGDTAGTDYELGTASGGSCTALSQNNCNVTASNCDSLGADLTKYLKNVPMDPKTGTAALTGYVVNIDTNNIITVKACLGENNTSIQASR